MSPADPDHRGDDGPNVAPYRRLDAVSTAILEDFSAAEPGTPGRDHECPVEAKV
jgi:hypothetical protein